MIRWWIAAIAWTCVGTILPEAIGQPTETKKMINGHAVEKLGEVDGKPVYLYTMTNKNGMVVKVTNYGGTVTEIQVPDRNGKLDDVVLGFDKLEGYLDKSPYFGCITGRVANRIAKGKFSLDGKVHSLAVNNGPNALHGGKKGFDKKVWEFREGEQVPGFPSVDLHYKSPDGEEGYPGALDTYVTYRLTDDNSLEIMYFATCDKPTPVNLTNHSYFNLAGQGKGTVLDHEVMIAADQYTPVDDAMIPTGELKSVTGTPMDFTKPTAIGARIKEVGGKPIGYDHNYVLRKGARPSVRVYEPKSGRILEMSTTEPGVQFYTGNFLDGSIVGKGSVTYPQYGGFCLEAQHFPDAVNQPKFPTVILKPGQQYKQKTVYKFSAK